MTTRSTLTRGDYENYLVYLYFGSNQDLLKTCINRAYRDFNRTMHGFGKFEKAGQLYDEAVILFKESLENLKSLCSINPMTVEVFDDWHETLCTKIVSLFREQGFSLFVGQAQKWVNMTLKYIFTLGEQRVKGFESAYPFCHVPLDSILLQRLEDYGFPSLNGAWSRLDNYDEYLEKQKWIRQRFSRPPMDIEFLLWQGKEIEE